VLVVVAIIAVLVAVLLPSLAGARAQARMVACSANMHQMGIALSMYTVTHKYYPGHHLGSATSTEFILWPVRLLRFMSGSGRRGTGQHQVYYCPNSRYRKRWNGTQRIWWDINSAGPNDCATFDYGYNDWGVGETYSIAGAPNLGLGGHIVSDRNSKDNVRSGEVSLDKLRHPSDLITIADNDADDLIKGRPGNWDTAIDPIDDGAREWPGARHNKGASVLWADGHANFQLQKNLVEKSHKARRRWNNDFRSHCAIWGDGRPADCPPEENAYTN
jgi:prepilin-type processing-associated H-X9-DG protein